MSNNFTNERILSMPCLEALRMIRTYSSSHPDTTIQALLSTIKSVEADSNSLDFEAAIYASTFIPVDCPLEGTEFYRFCIRSLLHALQPSWIKSIKNGRMRFLNELNDLGFGLRDSFVATGLLQEPIISEVLKWWDELSIFSYQTVNVKKMESGREAEIHSLKYEEEKLESLGIMRKPSWLGLDDNFVGYDIHSYDLDSNGNLVHRFIEVKSTVQSPPRIFVTKNEWKKAMTSKENYIFHVWMKSDNCFELFYITVDKISQHIPQNNRDGEWSVVEIRLKNLRNNPIHRINF